MNKGFKFISAAVLAVVVLVVLLSSLNSSKNGALTPPLMLYCAAGVKPAVLPLALEFERQYGQAVQIMYGGSGTLLSNVQVARLGDLYIAADQSYIEIAADKGLIDEILPLATQSPVIAVAKGNPKKILTLEDLKRADLRLALGNPESASIGKQTKYLLEKAGNWKSVKKQVEQTGVFKPTVPEVANDVKLGAVDAGIIWDSTAAQYFEIEAVHIPLFDEVRMQVSIAILKSSKQPAAALRFARYLNSPIGRAVFSECGFKTINDTE
ncbi:MAG: molybdate ABC transporter substrate-binding protein [Pontiella sp.]